MQPEVELNGGPGKPRVDEPVVSVGFEIPSVAPVPSPTAEPASFGSPPKRGRVGKWLRRGGVAWTAASVAFAAAIALGTVGVSERGQLSHTKAALVTQVSISRDLQRQVKAVTDKNGELDQQVSALNDRNSSVSSALDTCTQAVGVDEQFRQAVNDMMTAKAKGAFDTALARADQLYVRASALQDECLTQAGAGGSTL